MVVPATRAKVVFNELTGTIVAGGDIVIQSVAISHGNLNILVSNATGVSQPAALSGGTTTTFNQSGVGIRSGGGQFTVLHNGTTLDEIAGALNAMGVSSRDMIAIFQAIKEAVEEVTGEQPTRMGMSGTTVCKQLLANNIPAIGFSQNAEDTAHMAGERLKMTEIPLFGKILGQAFLKLGNTK